MGITTDRMKLEVFHAVPVRHPGRGETPAQVHDRVGRWARNTVRKALGELAEEDRIRFELGKDGHRRYRREPGTRIA